MSAVVLRGDARSLPLPDASVDAVVTDPPYGLEFMGKEWDSFKTGDGFRRSRNPADADRDSVFGRTSRTSPEYRTAGAGQRGKPGIGERPTEWVSNQGWNAYRCRNCGHLAHGGSPCQCDVPDFARADDRWPVYQAWCEQWARECLRVLKPGGWMLAFGGTRTWHRLTCAIEDAGFEIRENVADLTGIDGPGLAWLYGQGFPKSLDVSKAIDKAAGAEREVVGPSPIHSRGRNTAFPKRPGELTVQESGRTVEQDQPMLTAPATEDAARWEGWGTALKPAWEPIVVARKPLAGTVVQNVLAHGTGALNIDGCLIHTEGSEGKPYTVKRLKPGATLEKTGGNWRPEDGEALPWEAGREYEGHTKDGRWPSNVVLGAEAAAELDRQSGVRKSGDAPRVRNSTVFRDVYGEFAGQRECPPGRAANEGGASRFFPVFRYEAKAGPDERPRLADGTTHPTVKPVDLMRWLVRLVTPPGGLVLDPFAGSGTTGEACVVEGFRCLLVELDPKSAALARKRLSRAIQPVLFGGDAA